MENRVGYRFRPTDVELVEVFLRPKNSNGDTSHVDRSISTLNICSFDPWELRSQSVIQSSDQIWYFFGRIERKYKRGDQQVRNTKSGFWKKTGKTMAITGKNRKIIGEKRVLVFHFNKSKKTKTNWVMHEYHLSPLNQMMTYTMCKVKFKGAESEINSHPGNEISISSITDINNSGGLSSASEVVQSQNLVGVEGLSFELMLEAISNMSDEEFNNLLKSDEYGKIVSMQEDCNN